MLPFLSEAQLILNIGKWPSVLRRSFRFRRFRVPHTKPFCLWMHPCFHIRLRFAASVRAALHVLISSYAFPPGSNLALFLFYQKGSLFVRHGQCYAYTLTTILCPNMHDMIKFPCQLGSRHGDCGMAYSAKLVMRLDYSCSALRRAMMIAAAPRTSTIPAT